MPIMDQMDALIADAGKVVQEASDMKGAVTQFGQDQYNKGWDEAMVKAHGDGTVDPANPKLYSEAEMNAIIAQTQAPLNEAIAAKQAIIDGIEAQVKNAVDESLAKFKADLKSKYLDQQVAESQGETGFGSLLD